MNFVIVFIIGFALVVDAVDVETAEGVEGEDVPVSACFSTEER
jgi:hypothetical protein